ncbi:MAG: nitroreductase family protein, partial [Acidimicrobiia bacterium]
GLGEAAEVEAWRAAVRELEVEMATGDVGMDGGAGATIEEVILRRGSTRRFSHRPIPKEALLWSLQVGARGMAGDFVAGGWSLLQHFVAVHAADGVEVGIYRWTADGLELIRAGAPRQRTSYLCLEQGLGGDAAATVFSCSPLEPVLEAMGARGYRMAQLEAGIACGRLHLAAYALGSGATGLTFYDDEVRRYFGTESEPMLVTAIGIPAYRSRRGRRPSESAPLRLEASG